MVEFIQPPRELRQKTGKGVPGAGLRSVRTAEDAFKRHQNRVDYGNIAGPSLDRLSELLSRLILEPADSAAAKQAYEIAHNLRGEGGSFGYPAVSQVATLMSRVFDGSDDLDRRQLDVIRLQLATLKAIVRSRAKGAPSGITIEVISGLAQLVERYVDYTAPGAGGNEMAPAGAA
ncbi:MAG: Hpt domain-containing protein [Proteobacteria bacterium]|nr:Hpt domain-containing protein [Pseudomonadota bacterium]MBI3496371.1 Hpt domain-containing protein [Pseudomonadota bacterium]